jgi:hypothetical protein
MFGLMTPKKKGLSWICQRSRSPASPNAGPSKALQKAVRELDIQQLDHRDAGREIGALAEHGGEQVRQARAEVGPGMRDAHPADADRPFTGGSSG